MYLSCVLTIIADVRNKDKICSDSEELLKELSSSKKGTSDIDLGSISIANLCQRRSVTAQEYQHNGFYETGKIGKLFVWYYSFDAVFRTNAQNSLLKFKKRYHPEF